MHSVGFVAVILSPALVAVSVISSQCCPQLFKSFPAKLDIYENMFFCSIVYVLLAFPNRMMQNLVVFVFLLLDPKCAISYEEIIMW